VEEVDDGKLVFTSQVVFSADERYKIWTDVARSVSEVFEDGAGIHEVLIPPHKPG